MKKPGIFAASVAVATSASALSVASFSSQSSVQEDVSKSKRENRSSSSETTPATDKFGPRFDGLRFIETLVTAHR